MDIIDEANAAAEMHLMKGIAAARASIPTNGQDQVPLTCDECGDEIPEARRKALPGCRTCIHCQEEIESGRSV